MEQAQGRARARSWFTQFPAALRHVALIRLIAMLGAGGVLYLTPMVFHQAQFSAGRVTEGLALAALAGTLGRILSGLLLDRGLNCAVPVLLAALMAIAGDVRLMGAGSFSGYLQGQVLLGMAVGFYWPAIELAVPLCCAPVPSGRAFALMRSADALGIAVGALVGAVLAWRGWLRGIYAVDIGCMLVLLLVLSRRELPDPRPRERLAHPSPWGPWLPGLVPLLAVAVLATAMPALMQSALPLELVRGSLLRRALPVSLGALTIGLQLALLLLLQWPVGQALARRPVTAGLNLSLLSFAAGNLLLAASAYSERGLGLLLLAQLPLALGMACFLPTATEAVVERSPIEHQGLALALLSQCFAISGFGAPLLAGRLLDGQGHGAGLWLLMAVACLGGLLLVRGLGPRRALP
ncbi:MFS transporter [Cyanobium gracile UHCC 0139]|uniref:MFS transporter n=1 Tax=Cyanobium gracile UHCC 0139 TaxID=3110308 RepID=A0ABU5RTJ3_9CYAN|nr:MFS transporter [Cyanobium gracile]MEA5391097.1 MFS transporter [Cyanobium gracile UHCC 0139]